MKYRTIVADPPWDYGKDGERWPLNSGPSVHHVAFPYETMPLEDIAALPIPDLAEQAAWLCLWTTNRYMPDAFVLLDGWGFCYRQTLVWYKRGASPFGGTATHNAAEFLLIAARGHPRTQGRWPHGSVTETGRVGAGKHSTKPDVFLDLIETAFPGPYLELFARRNRLGWDTWGNESLEMVQL